MLPHGSCQAQVVTVTLQHQHLTRCAVGFQDSVATSAKQQNVIVQSYNIIYELIEGVRWGPSCAPGLTGWQRHGSPAERGVIPARRTLPLNPFAGDACPACASIDQGRSSCSPA